MHVGGLGEGGGGGVGGRRGGEIGWLLGSFEFVGVAEVLC